jgi:hypothetical protein
MARTPRAYSEESPLPNREIPFFFDESEAVEDGLILKFCHPDTDLSGQVRYFLGEQDIDVEFDAPIESDWEKTRFVHRHIPKDFYENIANLRFSPDRPDCFVRPGFGKVERNHISVGFFDKETYLSGYLSYNAKAQEYSASYEWRDEPPECHPGHEYPEPEDADPEQIEWLLSVAPEAFTSLVAEVIPTQDQVPESMRP